MFTGIITACQEIESIQEANGNKIFTITKPKNWNLEIGESITIDGVCTTVISIDDGSYSVELMPETLRLTTLDTKSTSDKLNLERSLKAEDLMSGHMVYGHIETTGKIENIKQDGDSFILTISHDPEFNKFIIQKGSITLNGISLTVIDPSETGFSVSIIPHTWTQTNLHTLDVGDKVNLEYDVIAKYIDKLQSYGR